MAGSPPALPGFGNAGKSFLIDNLLQSQTPSSPPDGTKGSHLRLVTGEHLRRTWASGFGLYQSQPPRSPQQVKDLGGPPLPHSGGKVLLLLKLVPAAFGNEIDNFRKIT